MPASTMTARLVPVSREWPFEEAELTKPETTIGRSRQNDIQIEDPSVSRLHARIQSTSDGFLLTDNGSLHGTRVNGQPVESRLLSDNDVIDFGTFRVRFVAAPRLLAQPASGGQVDHLRLLLDLTRALNSSLDLGRVLNQVIDSVIQVTGAERGFLMLPGSTGDLEFRVGRNVDRTDVQMEGVALSASVVRQVRLTGEPVFLSNALESGDSPASLIQMGIRSVMCVPLKTSDRFVGLIYVDSHQTAKCFSGDDLELFQSLANHAALAIEKSQLYEQLQQHSSSLEEQVRSRTLELVQAEKLATVGRLSAGVAHEINSPLGVLISNIDLLRTLLASPQATADAAVLEDIARSSRNAGDRLKRIVKAFEAFAGLDEAELKMVRIDDAIDDVLALLQREVPDGIVIEKVFEETPLLRCAPGRIHQALMNLVLNAVQSIEGQGVIRIRTARTPDGVRIQIEDTGRGMSPDVVARAFDPGFTTKRNRVGVSMGLPLTAHIVRDHGGDIRIQSEPGKGTTVTISLPAGN